MFFRVFDGFKPLHHEWQFSMLTILTNCLCLPYLPIVYAYHTYHLSMLTILTSCLCLPYLPFVYAYHTYQLSMLTILTICLCLPYLPFVYAYHTYQLSMFTILANSPRLPYIPILYAYHAFCTVLVAVTPIPFEYDSTLYWINIYVISRSYDPQLIFRMLCHLLFRIKIFVDGAGLKIHTW